MQDRELGELAVRLHTAAWSPRSAEDDVLRTRLLALSGRDWLRLDHAARRQAPGLVPPAGLPAWRGRLAGPPDVLAAGSASFHRDGQVRQAAVEVLAVNRDVLATAFLAVRATDWVQEVRKPAGGALPARTSTADVTVSVPVLLASVARHRSEQAVRLLAEIALTDRLVLSLARHRDRATALWALARCRERGLLPEHRLLGFALHAQDQVAAAWCANELAAATGGPSDEAAHRLLAAPRALARAAALQAFPDSLLPDAFLRKLCLDRSSTVRSLARWRFTRLGGDAVAL